MVLDIFDNARRYAALHPQFERAFEVLARRDQDTLAPGRHTIDGDRLYLIIDDRDGRSRDGARLEAHRRYIDIQLTLGGTEEIGWRPLAGCRHPTGAFDVETDIVFFDDRPETWITVPPASFAIFFPEDAHAPLGGRGVLRKAIVKVER